MPRIMLFENNKIEINLESVLPWIYESYTVKAIFEKISHKLKDIKLKDEERFILIDRWFVQNVHDERLIFGKYNPSLGLYDACKSNRYKPNLACYPTRVTWNVGNGIRNHINIIACFNLNFFNFKEIPI